MNKAESTAPSKSPHFRLQHREVDKMSTVSKTQRRISRDWPHWPPVFPPSSLPVDPLFSCFAHSPACRDGGGSLVAARRRTRRGRQPPAFRRVPDARAGRSARVDAPGGGRGWAPGYLSRFRTLALPEPSPRSGTPAPTARARAALPWKRRGRRGGARGGLSGSRAPAHARALRSPWRWAPERGLRPCATQDVEAQLGKPVTAPGPQLPRAATREGSGGGVEPSSVGLRAELRRWVGGWTVAAALWGLSPWAAASPGGRPSRSPGAGPRTAAGRADAGWQPGARAAQRGAAPGAATPQRRRRPEPDFFVRLHCGMWRPGPEWGPRGGGSALGDGGIFEGLRRRSCKIPRECWHNQIAVKMKPSHLK